MIVYAKLWQTMKERGISQYKLEKEYNFSRGTLNTLRKNGNVTVYTLDTLCRILNCRLEDIAEYIPDE
ncbi:MAG: helix-turn-helix transcriptional regulator [Clostridia bacterium]|nr:helix-turn-helix transcriptional regulator [Clostridia bacterium]